MKYCPTCFKKLSLTVTRCSCGYIFANFNNVNLKPKSDGDEIQRDSEDSEYQAPKSSPSKRKSGVEGYMAEVEKARRVVQKATLEPDPLELLEQGKDLGEMGSINPSNSQTQIGGSDTPLYDNIDESESADVETIKFNE